MDDGVRFSSSAAPAWAKLLYTCYTTTLETLSQEKELDQKQKIVREARRPTSTNECRELLSALALLDDAIRGGIVERLFQEKLVQGLRKQYFESMEKKTNPRLASMCRIVIHPTSLVNDSERAGAINRAKARSGVKHDIEYYYDGMLYVLFLDLRFAQLCHQPTTSKLTKKTVNAISYATSGPSPSRSAPQST